MAAVRAAFQSSMSIHGLAGLTWILEDRNSLKFCLYDRNQCHVMILIKINEKLQNLLPNFVINGKPNPLTINII